MITELLHWFIVETMFLKHYENIPDNNITMYDLTIHRKWCSTVITIVPDLLFLIVNNGHICYIYYIF